jgi:hypothetical protein
MAYLILNLVALALLIGFFALTMYETKRGARLFARERERFDAQTARAVFVFTHVDFAAFVRDTALHLAHRFTHDVAHLSLTAVRAVERLLTRLVRYLRVQHPEDVAPQGNAREFVKTLSDFKGHLEETHPNIPDILEKSPE